MNPRLISPFKGPNSSYKWFRLVVPPRYRQAVGRTEIKESLKTDDIGEARRLCGVQQHEWLKRFAAIDVELSIREAQQGIIAVGRFLER